MVPLLGACHSRRRLPRDEQFGIEFDLTFVGRKVVIRDKIVSIILAVGVLGALGMMGYAIVTPNEGQKFTEFYVLGPGGTAADYPKQLKVGEEQIIIPGIVNHEFQQVSYRLVILIDEEKINEAGPIILEHDEKWEQAVNFVPRVTGDRQKVEFLLYKDGETQPSQETLHLWVDVTA